MRVDAGHGVASNYAVNHVGDVLGVENLDVFVRIQTIFSQHHAHGVVGRRRRLGDRDYFTFEIRDGFDLWTRIKLKDESRHATGDINQISAFQLGVDSLIADQANFFATAEHRLDGGSRRQVFEIHINAL